MLSAGNLILALQVAVILVLICIALEFRRKELAYEVSTPEEQQQAMVPPYKIPPPEGQAQEPVSRDQGSSNHPVERDIALWNTGTDPIFERDYLSSAGLGLEAKGADILDVRVRHARFAEPTNVKVELKDGQLLIAPLLFQHGDRLTLRLRLSESAPVFTLTGSIKKVSTVREVRSTPAQLQWMHRCTLYVKAASVIGTLLVLTCFVKANVLAVSLPGPLETYLDITLAYLVTVILAFLLRRQLESSSSFTYPLAPAPAPPTPDSNS